MWRAMFGLPTFVLHCTMVVFSIRLWHHCLLIYCCTVVYDLCTDGVLQLWYYEYLYHFHSYNSFLASWKTCCLFLSYSDFYSVCSQRLLLLLFWYSCDTPCHCPLCTMFQFFFYCVGFGNPPPPLFFVHSDCSTHYLFKHDFHNV